MTAVVVLLVGTRPEAVKAAPLVLAMAEHAELEPVIVHSGQHPGMVEQALAPFGLKPQEYLSANRELGTQAELFAQLLPALDDLLSRIQPAAVLVQGDTSTTLAGALAAFWRRIPVVHLEAGLRTGDLDAPFPEEGNRQMVSRIASLHLAPTEAAGLALRSECLTLPNIVVTGNTVVDAVHYIAAADVAPASPLVRSVWETCTARDERLILVTAHRRESWGAPLRRILDAVAAMVAEHPDVRVLLPAHPNPEVRAAVDAEFAHSDRVHVTDPLNYPDLVWVLRRSALVLTDSGGIQEEAPSFGVPVLVLREVTERREAVAAGYAWLVGTDAELILGQCRRILGERLRLAPDANPYGDGRAAGRCVAAMAELL